LVITASAQTLSPDERTIWIKNAVRDLHEAASVALSLFHKARIDNARLAIFEPLSTVAARNKSVNALLLRTVAFFGSR